MHEDSDLPSLVVQDYRRGRAACRTDRDEITLVQWNVERGYKLDKILEELRRIDADIVSLQEVDWGCDRSGCADVGGEIAAKLGYNYAFVKEFDELRSPLRDSSSQGGGCHGNAILTKLDFDSLPRVIEHKHDPVKWNHPSHELARKEPRRGRRITLVADVVVPWRRGGRSITTVYCCHLEVFCGITDRVVQFSDILVDARSLIIEDARQWERTKDGSNKTQRSMCILGDLNTMAEGIVRLSKHYASDSLRWRTLGQSEASWWNHNVFAIADDGLTANPLPNRRLLSWGLKEAVARSCVNPGFREAFSMTEYTLDNPKYQFGFGLFHLVHSKLDWVLLRGLEATHCYLRNNDYAASDHKILIAHVQHSFSPAKIATRIDIDTDLSRSVDFRLVWHVALYVAFLLFLWSQWD